jgi:hypothetical protein
MQITVTWLEILQNTPEGLAHLVRTRYLQAAGKV